MDIKVDRRSREMEVNPGGAGEFLKALAGHQSDINPLSERTRIVQNAGPQTDQISISRNGDRSHGMIGRVGFTYDHSSQELHLHLTQGARRVSFDRNGLTRDAQACLNNYSQKLHEVLATLSQHGGVSPTIHVDGFVDVRTRAAFPQWEAQQRAGLVGSALAARFPQSRVTALGHGLEGGARPLDQAADIHLYIPRDQFENIAAKVAPGPAGAVRPEKAVSANPNQTRGPESSPASASTGTPTISGSPVANSPAVSSSKQDASVSPSTPVGIVPVKNQDLIKYAYEVLMQEQYDGRDSRYKHGRDRMQELFGVNLEEIERPEVKGYLSEITVTEANKKVLEDRFSKKLAPASVPSPDSSRSAASPGVNPAPVVAKGLTPASSAPATPQTSSPAPVSGTSPAPVAPVQSSPKTPAPANSAKPPPVQVERKSPSQQPAKMVDGAPAVTPSVSSPATETRVATAPATPAAKPVAPSVVAPVQGPEPQRPGKKVDSAPALPPSGSSPSTAPQMATVPATPPAQPTPTVVAPVQSSSSPATKPQRATAPVTPVVQSPSPAPVAPVQGQNPAPVVAKGLTATSSAPATPQTSSLAPGSGTSPAPVAPVHGSGPKTSAGLELKPKGAPTTPTTLSVEGPVRKTVTGGDIVNNLYSIADSLKERLGKDTAKIIGAVNNDRDEIVERLADLSEIKARTGHSIWVLAKRYRQDSFSADLTDHSLLRDRLESLTNKPQQFQTAVPQGAVQGAPEADKAKSQSPSILPPLPTKWETIPGGKGQQRPVYQKDPSSVTARELVDIYKNSAEEIVRILGKQDSAKFLKAKSESINDLTVALADMAKFSERNTVSFEQATKLDRHRFPKDDFKISAQEKELRAIVEKAREHKVDEEKAADKARLDRQKNLSKQVSNDDLRPQAGRPLDPQGRTTFNSPRQGGRVTVHTKNGAEVLGEELVNSYRETSKQIVQALGKDEAARFLGAKSGRSDDLLGAVATVVNFKRYNGLSIEEVSGTYNKHRFPITDFHIQEQQRDLASLVEQAVKRGHTIEAQHQSEKMTKDLEAARRSAEQEAQKRASRESSTQHDSHSVHKDIPVVTGGQIVDLYRRTARELTSVLGDSAKDFLKAKSNKSDDILVAVASKVDFKAYNGVDIGSMKPYMRSEFGVGEYRVAQQEEKLTRLVDAAMKYRQNLELSEREAKRAQQAEETRKAVALNEKIQEMREQSYEATTTVLPGGRMVKKLQDTIYDEEGREVARVQRKVLPLGLFSIPLGKKIEAAEGVPTEVAKELANSSREVLKKR